MKKREERNEFGKCLGEVVAQKRRLAKWRQRALARRIGIHESTLSKLETGKMPMKESHLRDICQALGIDVLQVVDEAFASYRRALTEREKGARNESGGPPAAEPPPGQPSLAQITARYETYASSQKELFLAVVEYLGSRS